MLKWDTFVCFAGSPGHSPGFQRVGNNGLFLKCLEEQGVSEERYDLRFWRCYKEAGRPGLKPFNPDKI